MFGLLQIIVVLVIVGLIIWLMESYLPIPEPIKRIIIVVIVLFLILWLLAAVGFIGGFAHPVPLR